MRKIRTDLVGVVMSEGGSLKAGDEVPTGAYVHPSLVEGEDEPSEDTSTTDPENESQGDGQDPSGESQGDGESEDFSDILSADEPKPAPKRSTGRRTAAQKG